MARAWPASVPPDALWPPPSEARLAAMATLTPTSAPAAAGSERRRTVGSLTVPNCTKRSAGAAPPGAGRGSLRPGYAQRLAAGGFLAVIRREAGRL